MSGASIATAAVAINAITVLRNMIVLPHPVAPEQDDAFVAKALQVRSRKPAGCDKIAHQSKPLQSAAAANAIYVAIDRPVFLFDHGIAVCCGLVASAPRRRLRGTGRDAGLRCRRRLVLGGGDASFEELPAAAGPSNILARLTA